MLEHLKTSGVYIKRTTEGGPIPGPVMHHLEAAGTEGENPEDDVFDLLVVGGGATGAGTALDAATRGLKVACVERDDFASGTSSKSTKLVHGGVRYLQKAVMELDYGEIPSASRLDLADGSYLIRAMEAGQGSSERTKNLPGDSTTSIIYASVSQLAESSTAGVADTNLQHPAAHLYMVATTILLCWLQTVRCPGGEGEHGVGILDGQRKGFGGIPYVEEGWVGRRRGVL